MPKYDYKYISIKKIYRLVCYKQVKESKPERNLRKSIKDVCPYGNSEIEENCKHCRWFQIIDETQTVKQKFFNKGTEPGTPLLIRNEDLDELPYDPQRALKESE